MKTYLIRENCPPNEAELEIKRFFKHVVVFDSIISSQIYVYCVVGRNLVRFLKAFFCQIITVVVQADLISDFDWRLIKSECQNY